MFSFAEQRLRVTCASLQVRHGCDATCWGPGPSGCLQTLLHRAIDENNEPITCFLIRRSERPGYPFRSCLDYCKLALFSLIPTIVLTCL